MSDTFQPDNPPDLESIERQIRIEKMKEEIQELAGCEAVFGQIAETPPELEEEFLEQVLAFERGPFDTDFNRLIQRGIELPPAPSLTDPQVSAKLWEVIEALTRLRVFLENTDHLSDRQLYEWLWSDGLRQENPDLSGDTMGGWHLSPIGGCSEEDNLIYLKYYADEKTRENWRNEYPLEPWPEHEDPPFDRDRHLPERENF